MEVLTIALVGCSKQKNTPEHGYLPARDLYASDLFRKRVSHVESRGLPWFILSAKGGLLSPSVPVRTYDCTMSDLTEIEVAEWHLGVANQLMTALFYDFHCQSLSRVRIELHAGQKYCEPLATFLKTFGIQVSTPLAGLGIGEQLAYYKRSHSNALEASWTR